MDDDRGRPSPLSGLWAFVVGGIGLIALTVALNPITRPEDCPNYNAGGNASAFSNSAWDLYLPLMALGWLALIVVEQLLPSTRRHRDRVDIVTRAMTALGLALIASCCLLPWLLIVCH